MKMYDISISFLHENIEMETYVYFNFHWEDENDWIVSFWLNRYEHSIYLKSNYSYFEWLYTYTISKKPRIKKLTRLYSFDPIWSTLIAGKIIDRHIADMWFDVLTTNIINIACMSYQVSSGFEIPCFVCNFGFYPSVFNLNLMGGNLFLVPKDGPLWMLFRIFQ